MKMKKIEINSFFLQQNILTYLNLSSAYFQLSFDVYYAFVAQNLNYRIFCLESFFIADIGY